jgi:hypothetical protein
MIRLLSAVLSLLLVTFAAADAFACPHYETKILLMRARENLVTMLDADAAKHDELQAEITKASAGIDATLAGALADATLPPATAKLFGDLKSVWEEFKKTRDGEIIPALRAGKKDEAKALATGVQAERYKKMNDLLTQLGVKV